MKYRHDPEGLRLPVKLDASSNGEYEPIPLEAVHHHANFLAHETANVNAKRLGLDRRSFLVSACGVAGSLLGMNTAYARQGNEPATPQAETRKLRRSSPSRFAFTLAVSCARKFAW